MSRPIDEKIVRMTLDNDRFKKDVASTIMAFEDINRATSDAGNMDLSSMAEGISNIDKKFSATGVIIGSVLKSVTDKALSTGKNLYHALVDPIVQGGKTRALNLEQAKFQFEGLGMDVEATMASALAAVKGTAFGLDEAAVVAGQFGASGMRAGDEMTASLLGISGVAAMTGSSYADVGSIFTKVAGNGRLMGDDLLRLSSRGVNAAAVLADEFELTEEAVREMVTAGEVSFDMFSTAMSNAFGEHATRANETYTGSLSNLKAALSRIGADIATPKLEYMRDLFNTMTPIVDDLGEALQPLIKAFVEMQKGAIDGLANAISKIDFAKFTELGGINNLLIAFGNVVGFGKNMLGSLSEGFRRVFPGSFMTGIVNITEWIKNLTSNLKMTDSTASKIATVFQGVFSVFSSVVIIATELGKAMLKMIPEGTGGKLLDLVVYFADMAIAMNDSLKEGNALTSTIEFLGSVFKTIGLVVSGVVEGILRFTAAITEQIGPAVDWLISMLGPLGDLMKDVFGDGGFSMENLMGAGVLVGGFLAFEKIQGWIYEIIHITKGLTLDISANIRRLGTALGSFISSVKYKNLLTIALALGVLAVSLKLIESLSFGSIVKGIIALAASMAILATGMMVLDGIDFSKGIRIAAGMVALAIAVSIMASALRKVADLKPEELTRGIVGLAAVMAVLAGGIIGISKLGGKMAVGSLQLIALATAIRIMASAVDKMASIDTVGLVKSIAALVVIFGAIAVFMRVASGSSIGVSAGLGLVLIASAIQIIVSAVAKIADIDTPNLVKGVIALTVILGAIATIGTLGSVTIAGAAGVLVMAIALRALVGPITKLSLMSWEELAKGLLGMSVALTAVALVGTFGAATIAGAAGVLVMAVALTMLMVPILAFSKMSWGGMIKGLIGLTGALLVMGVLGTVLGIVSPLMILAGVGLIAMGAGMALVALSVGLFATALVTLVAVTATSISAIISSFSMLIKGATSLIVDIVNFVVELGEALIGGFERIVPKLIITVMDTALKIATAFRDNLDQYIEVGSDILTKIMEGLGEHFPDLIDTAQVMMIDLMDGMSDALENNGDAIIQSMMRLMGEVIIVVTKSVGEILKGLFFMFPSIQKGIDKAISGVEEKVRDQFGAEEIGVSHGKAYNRGLESSTAGIGDVGEKITHNLSVGMDRFGMQEHGRYVGGKWVTGVEESEPNSVIAGTGLLQGIKSGTLRESLEDTGTKIGNDIPTGAKKAEPAAVEVGEGITKSLSIGVDTQDLVPMGEKKGTEVEIGIGKTLKPNYEMAKKVSTEGKKGVESVDWKPSGASKGDELEVGVSSKIKLLQEAGKGISQSGEKGSRAPLWTSSGQLKALEFSSGVGSKKIEASNQGKALANSGESGTSKGKSWFATGANLASGFIKGIGSKVASAAVTAASLASAAATKISSYLKERSPSRLTMETGSNFGEGFILGIASKIKDSGKAATEMAKEASEGVMRAMSIPEENEIKFEIIIDDSDVDWDAMRPVDVGLRPDAQMTNQLVNSASTRLRQNENNLILEMVRKLENKYDDQELLEATIEQNSILSRILHKDNNTYLDGREVAKGTYKYNKQLQDRDIVANNRARGI